MEQSNKMNINDELDKIKKDCAWYLERRKASKHPNAFLFRGMFDGKNIDSVFTTKTVRANRKPMNTPQ